MTSPHRPQKRSARTRHILKQVVAEFLSGCRKCHQELGLKDPQLGIGCRKSRTQAALVAGRCQVSWETPGSEPVWMEVCVCVVGPVT